MSEAFASIVPGQDRITVLPSDIYTKWHIKRIEFVKVKPTTQEDERVYGKCSYMAKIIGEAIDVGTFSITEFISRKVSNIYEISSEGIELFGKLIFNVFKLHIKYEKIGQFNIREIKRLMEDGKTEQAYNICKKMIYSPDFHEKINEIMQITKPTTPLCLESFRDNNDYLKNRFNWKQFVEIYPDYSEKAQSNDGYVNNDVEQVSVSNVKKVNHDYPDPF
jgi:hypothetical protein